MKTHTEYLILKWQKEIDGWHYAAKSCKDDKSLVERCFVRSETLQGCIDDLKTAAKKDLHERKKDQDFKKACKA